MTRLEQRAEAIRQRAIGRANRRRLGAVADGIVSPTMTVEEFIVWEDAGRPGFVDGNGNLNGNPHRPHPLNIRDPAVVMPDRLPDRFSSSAASQADPSRKVIGPHAQPGSPFTDRIGVPLDLSRLYAGATVAFLILSGPSINSLDLSLLDRRGIITAGVNNSPVLHRVNLWIYVDTPDKFHDAIWLDPFTLKFVPLQNLFKPLHQMLPDGTLVRMMKKSKSAGDATDEMATISDMPAVIGHKRNANFDPADWLAEDSINWGNSKRSAHRNGLPHTLNVMFAAVKLIYALGFRTLFLLGCDFFMHEDQPYAFSQTKHAGGCASNNHAYGDLNKMFAMLKPEFDKVGYRVLNCNPRSGLTVFEHLPYERAVEWASEGVPQDPLRADGWYYK